MSYSYSKTRILDEQGKVKFENRNPCTNPLKKGKGADVYFSNALIEDKHIQKKLKEASEEEYKNKIARVKSSKVKRDYKASFFPPAAKQFPDYFSRPDQLTHYKQPLYYESDKKLKINKEKKTVYTENRNMAIAPLREGTSSYPGIYFSYPVVEDKDFKKMKVESIKERQEDLKAKKRARTAKKVDDRQAFRPAALKKNDPFFDEKMQRSPEPKLLKQLYSEAVVTRKKRRPKFKQPVRPHTAEHIRAFRPPHMDKKGFEGNFHNEFGVPFVAYPKVKYTAKKKEKKEYKKPFTDCRLMTATTYSPSISSFKVNLKSEFPSCFRKNF